MKEVNTFLITGCGGDIGISLSKILRQEFPKAKIMGTDINSDTSAFLYFDKVIVVPRADDSNYFEVLKKVIQDNNIKVLIPSTEPELDVLLKEDTNELNIKIVRPSNTALKIGLDKYKTCEFLKENNLPFPKTILASELPKSFPIIFKAKSSSGSKTVKIVKDIEEAMLLSRLGNQYIWQEYIPDSDGEYTCGLYRSKKGEIRSLILKRKLMGGLTGQAVVVLNNEISSLLEKIAKGLDLTGSINIQLRLMKERPYVFEINPRFSSTVYFRHLMGYQDLLWAISECLEEDLPPYSPPEPGTRIYRLYDEKVIPPSQ